MLVTSIILEAAVAIVAILAARKGKPYIYGLAFTFGAYVLYDLARLLQWDVQGGVLSGLFLVATITALIAVWGLYREQRSDFLGIDAWRLRMKALLYSATFAILVSTPVLAADSVSLVGTWVGQRDRIAKVEGRRGGLATLVITEQQGNTFVGRLKRSNTTGDEEEPLWGAFTPGGKLMMGSDDEGTYIFSLIDQNTLDYCYSETGRSPRSVCARLTRQP